MLVQYDYAGTLNLPLHSNPHALTCTLVSVSSLYHSMHKNRGPVHLD
jgi:hypothetical protein